jgi:hypothetical protein
MTNYGILVGVSRYYDPQISNLVYAGYAIKQLRDALISSGQFDASNIEILIKADKDQNLLIQPLKYSVISTLLNISKKWPIQKSDFLLFYFIGHGYGSAKGDRVLTMDTCFQYLDDTALSTEALIKLIGPIPAQGKLLVFDACRNEVEVTLGPQEGMGKTKIEEFITIYACKPGEQAYIPRTDRLPLLTKAFVEAVKKETCRSARDMYNLICDRVQESSYKIGALQTPDITSGGKELSSVSFLSRQLQTQPNQSTIEGFEKDVIDTNTKLHYLYDVKYPHHAPSYHIFVHAASPLQEWEQKLDRKTFRRLAFNLIEKNENADIYTLSYMLRWGPDNILLEPLLDCLESKKYRGTVVWQALDAIEVMLRDEKIVKQISIDDTMKERMLNLLKNMVKRHPSPTEDKNQYRTSVVWGKALQICKRIGIPQQEVFQEA